MAAWLRFLANPKLWARFMKSKAGRKSAFKWGSMLIKSRAIQGLIDKFIGKNGKTLDKNKEYRALERKYKQTQKRVKQLEKQVQQNRDNQLALQTDTFTLGRQIIEMQRMYAQMQSELQQVQQHQLAMVAAGRTR